MKRTLHRLLFLLAITGLTAMQNAWAQDSNDLLLFAYSWQMEDADAAEHIKHPELIKLREALATKNPKLLDNIIYKDLKLVGQAILTNNAALTTQIEQKDWARFTTCALNYKALIKLEDFDNQDFYYISRFIQTRDPDFLQYTAYLSPDDLYYLGMAILKKDENELKKMKSPYLFAFGTALVEVNMFKLDEIKNNNLSLLGKAMVKMDANSLNAIPYKDFQNFAKAYIYGQTQMLEPIANKGLKLLGEALITKNPKLLDKLIIYYDEDPISYTGSIYSNSDLYYLGLALIDQDKAQLYNIEDQNLATVGFAAISKDQSFLDDMTSNTLQYLGKYLMTGDKLYYGMINNPKWFAFCKALDTKQETDIEAIPDHTFQLLAKAVIEQDAEILEGIENVE